VRVERLELEDVEGRLERPAPGGQAGWTFRRGVRIRLHAQGLVGLGESAPLPGYSVETLSEVRAALVEVGARELVVEPAAPVCECLARALRTIPSELPCARFGLETALLDLLSRLRGVPVHRLLRGDAPPPRLPVAALLMGEDVVDVVKEAGRALEVGAAALKFKLAGDRGWARVEAVRSALPDATLRLDFNQGLSRRALRPALERAARLGVELVEEPTQAWSWDHAAPPPCRVFADESLREQTARRELPSRVAAGELAGAVLKPALLGGLSSCLELAEQVRAAGGECFVTHLFDGPVARAACAELALALGAGPAHGLAPHVGLGIWPGFEAAAVSGYRITSHDRPGLGQEREA